MAHLSTGIPFIFGIPGPAEHFTDLILQGYRIDATPRTFVRATHQETGKTYYVASSIPGQPPGHTLYRLRPAELIIDDQDTIHIPATP